MTDLSKLITGEQDDNYEDPRIKEVVQVGVERLKGDNTLFQVVARDSDGRIFYREPAFVTNTNLLDGLVENCREAFRRFYKILSPEEKEARDRERAKQKKFLEEQGRREIERCQPKK